MYVENGEVLSEQRCFVCGRRWSATTTHIWASQARRWMSNVGAVADCVSWKGAFFVFVVSTLLAVWLNGIFDRFNLWSWFFMRLSSWWKQNCLILFATLICRSVKLNHARHVPWSKPLRAAVSAVKFSTGSLAPRQRYSRVTAQNVSVNRPVLLAWHFGYVRQKLNSSVANPKNGYASCLLGGAWLANSVQLAALGYFTKR